MDKVLLTRAEIEDLFAALIDAPTPDSRAALTVEMQAACANLVEYSNKCLAVQGGWREQGKAFSKMMERQVRGGTALDALRALARGDWNSVDGIQPMSVDAAKAFQGVE
jgi:hypothetical protein